jgi:hypothetical protein
MGMNLGTDLTALEAVGEGIVLEHINTFLNKFKWKDNIACYQFDDNSKYFVDVKVLFLHDLDEKNSILKFRIFEYSREDKRIQDLMENSLKYGTGITEFQMNAFLELKKFYLENTPCEVVEGEEAK